MDDKAKQDRIRHLRKLQAELDNLSDEEFEKIVESKFGKDTAKLVTAFGFSGYAREMITKKLEAELKELGG